MVNLRFWRKPSAEGVDVFKRKEDKGTVDVQARWTDKQAHPTNMSRYEQVCNDPEVSVAMKLLAEMVASGYYTEMSEEVEPDHPNKARIDEYGETVNLDEDLKTAVRVMLSKGFCPIERLEDYDLKILPPEGFYIWKTKKGHIYRYTQEVSGSEVNRWNVAGWQESLKNAEKYYVGLEKQDFNNNIKESLNQDASDANDIILFINDEDPSHPYGKALVDPIVELIEERAQMNKDIPSVIHRLAYPVGVVRTSRAKDNVQKAFTDKDPDQWVFMGNTEKDEFEWDVISTEIRVSWIDYIELIYYQICEALHAPLLLYLKNATEASANVMLEAVDRYVQGIQRYVKRRVERYLFEPQCGEPVPRLVWGQPRTGLEDIELGQLAQLYNVRAVTFNQIQDLLKQVGLNLIEPEVEQPVQPTPFQPGQAPLIPVEKLLEKLSDLTVTLRVIETNYQGRRISLVQAVRDGGKAIDVHFRRMYPNDDRAFQIHRDEEFQTWVRKLMGVVGEHEYRVSVK